MIYKSYCSIDIQYYPFDSQNCTLKFGTWTYDGSLVNLQFINNNQSAVIEDAWDLEDYTPSIEWEIIGKISLAAPTSRSSWSSLSLDLRAIRHEKVYACCAEVFLDLTFTCSIRRKPLFYVVNLIVPCVNISVLAVLVFLLPSDSRRKINLSISILVALLVFYLLLIDLIPPTSLVIPLLGKYLLFTLVLVNLSITITIITLNVHFRRHSTLCMAAWVRNLLLVHLPKLLWMQRPRFQAKEISFHRPFQTTDTDVVIRNQLSSDRQWKDEQRKMILRASSEHIAYIAKQIENSQNEKEVGRSMEKDRNDEWSSSRLSKSGALLL